MTNYDILGTVGLTEGLFYVRVDDSNTLMRGHVFEDHCFTVHDEAGLDALPVGARLLDAGGDQWVNLQQGWIVAWMLNTVLAAPTLGTPHWQNVELANEDFGPFTLLNPEILGDLGAFAAEVDMPATPRRFTAGQVVRLKCTMNALWDRFLAEVISDDGQQLHLKPLSRRPDRNGWAKFTWGSERVELVNESTEREAA